MIVTCLGTAAIGLVMRSTVGLTPWAVVITVIGGLRLLRIMRLHTPPALAIGLLPFVMPDPTWLYLLSVGVGASLAAGSYRAYGLVQQHLGGRFVRLAPERLWLRARPREGTTRREALDS
ncbi:MAG: hypothetical protein AB7R89_01675 [Dehalococcoidia bacterium]